MTGGKIQAHALELGVALALETLGRSAGGSTPLQSQAPLLRPSLNFLASNLHTCAEDVARTLTGATTAQTGDQLQMLTPKRQSL
jgi:hypothetical protein